MDDAFVVHYSFLQCNLSYVFMSLSPVRPVWISWLDDCELFEFLAVGVVCFVEFV